MHVNALRRPLIAAGPPAILAPPASCCLSLNLRQNQRRQARAPVSTFVGSAAGKLLTRSRLSPDPRYCQGSYEFLMKEAEMLLVSKRPKWIPKPVVDEKTGRKQYHISTVGDGIMSTLNYEKSKVDIISSPAPFKISGKRGPEHRWLPEDLIRELAAAGMGSKAIVTKLKKEDGTIISYKTIQ